MNLRNRYVNIKITVRLKEMKHKIARKTVLFSTTVTDGVGFADSIGVADSIGIVRPFNLSIFMISIIFTLKFLKRKENRN